MKFNCKVTSIDGYNYYIGNQLEEVYNQESGIIISNISNIQKVKLYLLRLRNDFLIDGFIRRTIINLIKKYISKSSVFLEIGCGSMRLHDFISKITTYNAIDILLYDTDIKRILSKDKFAKICLGSITDIPIDSDSVSMVVSIEVLEHIPKIDTAIREIQRIMVNEGVLICSIPNNYCYKYQRKGPRAQHVNNWTFKEFIEYMSKFNFNMIEGFMRGLYLPLPRQIEKKASYQIPISSKKEFKNTNFFYVFKLNK